MRKADCALYFLFTAIVVLAAASCTPEACFDETESFVKATFYNTAKKKASAPDSVSLYGFGHESAMIYNKSTGVQPAQFPLNNNSDTSRFVIKINGVTDTLVFVYTSFPHLVSRECGFTIYHTLDTVLTTNHNIDYIYQANDNVTTTNEENIQISY